MGLSIVKTNNILKLLKFNEAIKSWKTLFYLMIFFLFGYLVAFYLFIYKIIDLIAVLTGLVFFLGSCFVLLSVNIYNQTLEKIIKIQEEYREAKETVEKTLGELKRTQGRLIHNEKTI
ncbi:hypothetical protein MEN41_16935 [Dolichospermum sp. ST_con]|nr:hypothetical protein [Dolichospermum sp. ST_con]MDD1422935.1 hypothetical protein [Dolichospermum sp. ST_sed9]MDD1430885.1 hypothetical protein [Dolichospermum sp. ST_sed6]MDD1435233.1 hypothetical protein [Dolichospermum sp. ST_sed10]MDD1454415.1 hypothetical protein [Dolichospermum sp. ST_sed7]MDD1458527.1 hypothetical protein [Dolichospermum sp. ST_sed2]MDD1464304.1 hypothetical protein [Dolichospermum sp. ST_sed5]MDD1471811.1 hypothetical protein [Dolichospermum sp. ST_sed4]